MKSYLEIYFYRNPYFSIDSIKRFGNLNKGPLYIINSRKAISAKNNTVNRV